MLPRTVRTDLFLYNHSLDGNIILATYTDDVQDNAVHIYKITIRFPRRNGQGGVLCQKVAKLGLASPATLSQMDVSSELTQALTHLGLARGQTGMELTLAFSNKADGKQLIRKTVGCSSWANRG